MLERPIQVGHERHLAGAVDAQAVGVNARPDGRVVAQCLLEGPPEVDHRDRGAAGPINHRIGVLRGQLVGGENGVDVRVAVERSERGASGHGEGRIVRVEPVGVHHDDEGRVRWMSDHRVDELLRCLGLEPVNHPGRERPAPDEDPTANARKAADATSVSHRKRKTRAPSASNTSAPPCLRGGGGSQASFVLATSRSKRALLRRVSDYDHDHDHERGDETSGPPARLSPPPDGEHGTAGASAQDDRPACRHREVRLDARGRQRVYRRERFERGPVVGAPADTAPL